MTEVNFAAVVVRSRGGKRTDHVDDTSQAIPETTIDQPGAAPGKVAISGTDYLVSAALLFTMIAHLAEIGPHWSEGTALGLFFVGSTAVLLVQMGLVLTRPSVGLYLGTVVTSVTLIGLYFLVREVSVPFVDHHDPYLAQEYPVKMAEALVVAAGIARIRRLRSHPLAPATTSAVNLTSAPETFPVIRTRVGTV